MSCEPNGSQDPVIPDRDGPSDAVPQPRYNDYYAANCDSDGYYNSGYNADSYADDGGQQHDSTEADAEAEAETETETEAAAPLPNEVKLLTHILADPQSRVAETTFGGSAQRHLPNYPGLIVDGFGAVPLPLTDARLVRRLAECGRATADNQAESSHAWEFPADRVQIKNPQWECGMAGLAASGARRLGCCDDVTLDVRLHKLVLHGPGYQGTKRESTGDEEGMIATLMIQLPSQNTGGELVVYGHPQGQDHDGGSTQYAHDFGAQDGTLAFASHYAVYSAGAEYEIRPVTSGYRLMLIYSLHWPPAPLQHQDLKLAQDTRMQMIDGLQSLAARSSLLYYTTHSYTEGAICRDGIHAFSGVDRDRIFKLQSANRGLEPGSGFAFFAIRAQRTVSAQVGDYCDDVSEEDVRARGSVVDTLVHMYDEHGNEQSVACAIDKQVEMRAVPGWVLNPDGVSLDQLWGQEFRKETSPAEDCDGNHIKKIFTKYVVYMVSRANPWAQLPFSGIDATYAARVPDPQLVTVEQLNSLLVSFPAGVEERTVHQHFSSYYYDGNKWTAPSSNSSSRSYYGDGVNVTARLLHLLVSRKLVDCVPTFFASIRQSLTVAMIQEYVAAMQHPDLWARIQPLLVAGLPNVPHAFSLAMALVREAMDAGIPESVWGKFLESITSSNVPCDLSKLGDKGFQPTHQALLWAMRSPRIWSNGRVEQWATRFFSGCTDSDALTLGLQLAISAHTDKEIDASQCEKILELVATKKHMPLNDTQITPQVIRSIAVPRIWQVVSQIVRNTFTLAARSDGKQDAFEHCLSLTLEFASAAKGNASAWEPLLEPLAAIPIWPDALMAIAFYSYRSSQLKRVLIDAMSGPSSAAIWPAIRAAVIDALSRSNSTFEIGRGLVLEASFASKSRDSYQSTSYHDKQTMSAWFDAHLQSQIPHQSGPHSACAWIDLVPITFSSPRVIHPHEMQDSGAQSKLWAVLAVSQHVPSIECAVRAYCNAVRDSPDSRSLQNSARALLQLQKLTMLPLDVLRALRPVMEQYVDGWAKVEKARVEEEFVSKGESLNQWQRQDWAKRVQELADDVNAWELVTSPNWLGRVSTRISLYTIVSRNI